jgi:hypothetical protein
MKKYVVLLCILFFVCTRQNNVKAQSESTNSTEINRSEQQSIGLDYGDRIATLARLPEDLTNRTDVRAIGFSTKHLESLEGIGAPNVTNIGIGGELKVDSLAPLNNLLHLRYLRLSLGGEKKYKISEITNLPSLETLRIRLINGSIDFQGIENLAQLVEIQIFGNGKIINIEGIGRLANLEHLIIEVAEWPEFSLEFLRDMPNLSALIIYNREVYRIRDEEFTPRQVLDISPLATLTKLANLECSGFIIKNVAALDALNGDYWYLFFFGSRLYNETDKSRHFIYFQPPAE